MKELNKADSETGWDVSGEKEGMQEKTGKGESERGENHIIEGKTGGNREEFTEVHIPGFDAPVEVFFRNGELGVYYNGEIIVSLDKFEEKDELVVYGDVTSEEFTSKHLLEGMGE